jgi:steroid delta-isomerase-like uncharacterized protein
MLGCQDKEAMAELEAMKAQAEVEEQNKATVERVIEEFNNGNFEIYKELCAPEYAFYNPSTTPNPMSLEETIEFLQMIFRAFPDINWSIKELFAIGDRVIVWNIVTGTHEGEFAGIPATGNKIEVSSILILRLENGKIVEEREEADMLGLMQQLGMELKPKETEK